MFKEFWVTDLLLTFLHNSLPLLHQFVYYESMKWELKTRPIYECRSDERLKTKGEESTFLTYTGFLGELEHLKIETRLDVSECDEWVCVLEVIGSPSIFKLIRKFAALTRFRPTLFWSCETKDARRKWNRGCSGHDHYFGFVVYYKSKARSKESI
jgi:hypothetical protein